MEAHGQNSAACTSEWMPVLRASSQGMPHRGDDLSGSLGLLCIWAANLGETFGEDSPLATGVPATPATQTQPEDHLRALDRKVFQRTPISAMARARDQNCVRADLSTERHREFAQGVGEKG
jgi:hypothetical protein